MSFSCAMLYGAVDCAASCLEGPQNPMPAILQHTSNLKLSLRVPKAGY